MSFLGAPKENAGLSENPVFITLLEHLFFFFQQNRELFRLSRWEKCGSGGTRNEVGETA